MSLYIPCRENYIQGPSRSFWGVLDIRYILIRVVRKPQFPNNNRLKNAKCVAFCKTWATTNQVGEQVHSQTPGMINFNLNFNDLLSSFSYINCYFLSIELFGNFSFRKLNQALAWFSQLPLKKRKMRSILQDLQANRRLVDNQPGRANKSNLFFLYLQ
ncbi:MAG: hypothetical protein LBC53_02625 [Spirochaetaceae bacterium]|jgi:hypothetical protein|nr:hypothetical protein [Spirochaetaceae bacterium]